MQSIAVRCENVFKTNDITRRTEKFTEKWVKFINQSIKNSVVIKK